MAIGFTLRQLEYLVAVGETGSVTLAAENLGVSPPTVSAAISQLEAELGVTLLNRTTRSLGLTEAGRTLLEGARRVLEEAAQVDDAVRHGADNLSGRVRIGARDGLGDQLPGDRDQDFVELRAHGVLELQPARALLELDPLVVRQVDGDRLGPGVAVTGVVDDVIGIQIGIGTRHLRLVFIRHR